MRCYFINCMCKVISSNCEEIPFVESFEIRAFDFTEFLNELFKLLQQKGIYIIEVFELDEYKKVS